MSNIYLDRLRSISEKPAVQALQKVQKGEVIHETPAVQALQKVQKGEVIHETPAVQALQKVQKGASCSFCSAPTTGIAENEALPARPDRTAFALRNHRDAVLHFRKMAADTERLAVLYRSKIDSHIQAARKRLPPESFDAWLNEIGGRHD